MDAMRIFLSHKSTNKPIVREYYDALKAAGFDPWMDEKEMPAGSVIDRKMKKGFQDSCAVVFFITPEFKDEKYLADEVNYAKIEERAKGDRFAIITLVIPHSGKGKPKVPDLLEQYVWISQDSHLKSLTKILEALPIRASGKLRWRTEPEPADLDANLRQVKGRIANPKNGISVGPNECKVDGTLTGYNQQSLYLFTGGPDRFGHLPRSFPILTAIGAARFISEQGKRNIRYEWQPSIRTWRLTLICTARRPHA
jgi:TIR domain